VKILLVDDDPAFRRLASMALTEAAIEHEAVPTAHEAMCALARGNHRSFDLVLLDQELPGMKGSEFLAWLRQNGNLTPVVLISVREGVSEKVRALDLGADDYVVKPFEFEELAARLRAVLRRNRTTQVLRAGNVELDPITRRATRAGRPMDLTAREFDVLWLLVQSRGRAVSRGEFLRRIWNLDFDPETNSLQVHISRLRRKLSPDGAALIETVRGEGYRVVGTGPSD
jgi:two-component system copper resistance phosphate regulon response regulator CusR